MAENRVSLQFPIFNPEQLAGNAGNYKLPSGMVVFVTKEVDGVLKYFIRVGDGQTELKNLANIGIDDHLKVKSLVVGTGEASDKSVAEGYNTKATGPHSHAEGSTTEALGQSSHAEGWKTKVQANAEAGHAEGYMSIAKGEASHAEGSAKEVANDVWENPTIAEGFASHAEGVSTKAIGQGSHSEGYGSEAKSQWSHAEGWETEANGAHSHAEGSTTKTGSDSAHAEGWYSQANGEASHAEGAATIASAFGAHAEGGPENYTESDGTYTIIGPTTASGEYAHAEGQGTTASGKASHAGGHGTIASGDYQTVIGTYNEEDSSALFIIGDGSSPDDGDRHNILKVKENSTEINSNLSVKGILDIKSNAGSSIFQVGTYQVTINKPVKVNSSTFSLNNKQVATQEYVQTKIAEAELAGGDIDTSNLVTKIELAEAVQDAMQGYVATDINDDECYEAIQIDITADDKLTLSGKNGSQKIILENGVQIVTSGAGTHTDKLTTSNELKTTGSFIIGKGVASELSIAGGTTTIDDYADKAGLTTAEIQALKAAIATAGGLTESIASAPMSIALGPNNESTVTGAITLGYGNKNSGFNSIAVGAINEVTGNSAFAYGYKNIVSGDFGVVFGQESQAGEMGFAGGVKSHATGKGAFAFGEQCQATNEYAHAEGGDTTASGVRSHAEGNNTAASGSYSHSEGVETIASGTASHAEGGPRIDSTGKPWSTTASGNYSHAEGAGTTASGHASHAEGEKTVASDYAHAEGYGTKANGDHSHAEGSTTTAGGTSSHAEGWYTQAIQEAAHAEGAATVASKFGAHAEGGPEAYAKKADGTYTITGPTTASGEYSHAEGRSTTASGDNSHAEGYKTIAGHANSHAGGKGTQTDRENQTVIGEYNTPLENALFIVGNGNGEGTDNRSNAFVVNKDGTATLSKGPSEDMDVATKAYVDGVFSDIDFSGLVTEAMLDDYVTESALSEVIGTADDDDNAGTIHGKINAIEAEIDDISTTADDAYKKAFGAEMSVSNALTGINKVFEFTSDYQTPTAMKGPFELKNIQGYATYLLVPNKQSIRIGDSQTYTYFVTDGELNEFNVSLNTVLGNKADKSVIEEIQTTANNAANTANSAANDVATATTDITRTFTLADSLANPTQIHTTLQFTNTQGYTPCLKLDSASRINVNGDTFVTNGQLNAFNASLNETLKSKVDQSQIVEIKTTADDAKTIASSAEQAVTDALTDINNTFTFSKDYENPTTFKGILQFVKPDATHYTYLQISDKSDIRIGSDDNFDTFALQSYVNTKIMELDGALKNKSDTSHTHSNYARIKTIDNKDTKDSDTIKGVRLYVDDKVSEQGKIISNIQSTIGENGDNISKTTVFGTLNKLSQAINDKADTSDLSSLRTSMENGLADKVTQAVYSSHIAQFNNHVTEFSSHLASNTVHVTTADRNKWNAAEQNVQSDWNVTNTSSDAYIKNKPILATVATSGNYNDLTNKPTIPTKVSELTNDKNYATKSTTLGGYGITNAYTKYEIGDILSGYVSNQNVVDMRAEIADNKTNIDSLVQNLNDIRIDMSRVTQNDSEQELELDRLESEKADKDKVYAKSEIDARFANIATHGDPNTYAVTTNLADWNDSLEIDHLDGYVTTIYVMLDNGDNCEESYATITLPKREIVGDLEEYNFTYKQSTSARGEGISMNNNTIVVCSSSSTSGQHGVVEIKIYKNFMSKTDKGQHLYMVDWKVIK